MQNVSEYDLAIIGGGVLGAALSYFASHSNRSDRIVVVEQEPRVAFHTSGRNTGKVHAPYLYDPKKRGLMARAAFYGFEMWEALAKSKNLAFKKDGVLHVSLDDDGTKMLEKYLKWGRENGLKDSDISLVEQRELTKDEPNVRCHSALRVGRDASVDYALLTKSLMDESIGAGAKLLLGRQAVKLKRSGNWKITLKGGRRLDAKFIINAAGGQAVDIAHEAGAAMDLTDMHFRGEYWKAPRAYRALTKTSVYSVPEFPEYPFLDPHWIVKADGGCEIGPNAVPVFSPYGYGARENIREFVPKMVEMLGSGARKAFMDKRFQELALSEVRTSISKPAMIAKVRRFLPAIDPSKITEKGTAGIRSSVVDDGGKFLPDAALIEGDCALHILNYNSPGATGALPFAVYALNQLSDEGHYKIDAGATCGPWKFSDLADKMSQA